MQGMRKHLGTVPVVLQIGSNQESRTEIWRTIPFDSKASAHPLLQHIAMKLFILTLNLL